MKKVLLMLSLAMLGVMLFASVASAEHTAAHVRAGYNGGPCSGDTPFEATLPGDPGEGSLQCFATQAEADAYSEGGSTASPTTSPSPSATASPTASPSASASASASPVASTPSESQYESELPDTGGASTLALGVVVLLVGSGLMTGFLLRRS